MARSAQQRTGAGRRGQQWRERLAAARIAVERRVLRRIGEAGARWQAADWQGSERHGWQREDTMRVKCAYCIRWFDSVDAARRHEQDFHSKSKQTIRRFDEVNPPISEMPQRAAQIDVPLVDSMSSPQDCAATSDSGTSDAGSTSCDGSGSFDGGGAI
jgi:hypothetical protein